MPFNPTPRVAPMLTRIRHFLTEEILPLEHTLFKRALACWSRSWPRNGCGSRRWVCGRPTCP